MIYVVTELQKVNDYLVVDAFKTLIDAKKHVQAIIEAYGENMNDVENDDLNWYDEDLELFDITITPTDLQ